MPTIQTIKIATVVPNGNGQIEVGETEVEAEVFGRWAVHASLQLDGSSCGYNVTYIPTGLAAVQQVLKVERARDIAQALSAELDVEKWKKSHARVATRILRRFWGWRGRHA